MKNFKDKVAAITGAGSGIGRQLAVLLARDGCHLALSDVNEAGLNETAGQLRSSGVRITTTVLDVSSREAVAQWASQTVREHGKVNLIFNNAGVALGSTVEGMRYEDFEWLMNINFWGVVHGSRAFLPHLERQPAAHIVNLSSIFGIIAPAGQTAYCASKFAVRGFSEALRHEFWLNKSPVQLTVVHPGGIKTNIVRNMRTGAGITDNARRAESIERFDNEFAKTTAQAAAQTIIAGIEKNAPRVLIGNDAKFMDLLQRFRPGRYFSVLQRGIEKRAAQAAAK